MKVLTYDSFFKKYMVRDESKLRNPKVTPSGDVFLPKVSNIHFIPETNNELGIDPSHSLMRNIGERAFTYHVEEMSTSFGNVRFVKSNTAGLIRAYHNKHRNMVLVRDLDKAMVNERLHMVTNYSMLPRLYHYSSNNMSVYHEWANMRETMWKTIKTLGTQRYNFIRFKMPEFLPARNEFNRFAEKFTLKGLEQFHTAETLDLLDLWKITMEDVSSIDSLLSDAEMGKTILTFVESGKLAFINLLDLVTWTRENPSKVGMALYKFFDTMMSERSIVETQVILKDAEAEVVTAPEMETAKIDTTVIDSLIKEQGEAGMLSAAEQRGLRKLANRVNEIPDPITGTKTFAASATIEPTDLQLVPTPVSTDAISIHDKSMLNSSIATFDKQYIEKVYHADIAGMILSLQNAGVVVKDVKVKEKRDAVTDAKIYSLQVQPIGGKQSTFTFTVPNINKDGVFLANDVKYRLEKQRGDMPITKIKPFMVGLTSYYGKAFVIRNQNASTNYGRWIRGKILKSSIDMEDTTIVSVNHGKSVFKDKHLPRAYTAIGVEISAFKTPTHHFFFNHNKLDAFFTPEELNNRMLKRDNLVPVGRHGKSLLGMDDEGVVYAITKDGIQAEGTVPSIVNSAWGEGPIEYTEVSVFSKSIPLILAFCYRFGFDKTLKILGLDYTAIPSGSRSPMAASAKIYRLKMKDQDLLIDIRDPKKALLVGGFDAVRRMMRSYTSASLNKKTIYTTILSGSNITVHHLRELDLMFDMFIDPITFDLLKEMGEPTRMDKLLLRANELLVDDWVPAIEPARFKGYERIPGMIYNQMVEAVRATRVRGNNPDREVTMKPQAVWLDILSDQSIALVEDSNPIHNLKEKEAVTVVGQGGRSAQTMMKESRGFTTGDIGIISEATPDSGKVGIRTFLSADPNLKNLRGVTEPYDPAVDGPTAVLSTSALLAPAVNHEDGKRVNFISIQNSRTTGAVGYTPLPFRTGYEQIVGSRADELFASRATGDGVVKSVTDEDITIEYKDGSTTVIELGVHHGKLSGGTVPHPIVTDKVVGDKVTAGEVVAFNKTFFERDLINPKAVAYKAGRVAKVALLESSDTIEDGSTISTSLAKDLAAPSTEMKAILVDFDMAVTNLVKVGDVVEPDDILCTLEDPITSGLSTDDEEVAQALLRLSAANPKVKLGGKVTRIEVLYYGDLETMSPSLQAIAKSDNARRAKRAKKLQDGSAKTGQIDSKLHVGGNDLTENMAVIKVYIDSTIGMGSGDKIVFANQLKSTCSRVMTDPILTEAGEEVEAFFGYQSISARIVLSPEISGTMNVILKKLSKDMSKLYREGK